MKLCQRKKNKVFISCEAKVLRSLFVCMFLLLCCAQHSQAKAKKEPTAKPKTAPAASQAMIENVKSALTANPWPIYLIYQDRIKGEIKSSVETDVLTFTQDAVVSQNLASQGYSKGGSSYRVRVDANGAYVWESIQLHKNQVDTVLLKGELKDGLMKGMIVYQPQGEPGRTVNFTTLKPE